MQIILKSSVLNIFTKTQRARLLAILRNPYLMYRSHKPMVKGVHIAQSLNKYKFVIANKEWRSLL